MTKYHALSRLVQDADLFLSRYWGRELLYVPGAARDGFDYLLRLTDIENLLATVPLPADLVRVYRNGEAEASERYTESVHTASHVEHSYVAVDALFRLYLAGGTVVLSALDRLWSPVRELCRALADELSHPVEAYAFITPAGCAGLATHVDHEATFLLQLTGIKHWTLFPRVAKNPRLTRPVSPDLESAGETVELRAGDVLYIPPGVPHTGMAADGVPSTHLNLSVTLTSWQEALMNVVATLTEDEYFQTPLPPRRTMDSDEFNAVTRERIERLRAALSALPVNMLYRTSDGRTSDTSTSGRFTPQAQTSGNE